MSCRAYVFLFKVIQRTAGQRYMKDKGQRTEDREKGLEILTAVD